ncbi:MAG TPA: hypothetical protein VFI73_12205 [Candidatus Nitrosopolaris sp.]|nr:hypothetical protein [Candidatus Nitrosopolaris sp.]
MQELEETFFIWRALVAITISVIADIIDFVAGPILSIPPVIDVPNALVTGILYAITRKKKSVAINFIKFIPIIGDFIPTYTITTLMWIQTEFKKRKTVEPPMRHILPTVFHGPSNTK